LVRYAEIPRPRQRPASPNSPEDVSIMMVAPASSGFAAISSATAKPSRSGMLASSSRSLNGFPICAAVSSASSAARPLSTAVGFMFHRVSCSTKIRRLTALSSTTRTGRSAGSGSDGTASVSAAIPKGAVK
jgi:hypothetical protein